MALDAASDAAAAIASAPPRARRGAGVGGPSPFEAAGARIPRGLAAQAPPGVHATPEAAGAGAGAPASAATSTGGGRGSTSSDSSAAAAPAGGGGDKCAAGAGGMQRDGSLASVPSDEPPPAAPRVVRFAPAPAALPIGGGSCLPPLTPQDTLAAGKLDEQLVGGFSGKRASSKQLPSGGRGQCLPIQRRCGMQEPSRVDRLPST